MSEPFHFRDLQHILATATRSAAEGMGLAAALCLVVTAVWGRQHAFGQSARTWTDASGRFSVEATLESVDNDVVSLRKTDDSVIEIAIRRLCEKDRQTASQIWFDRRDQKQFEAVREHLAVLQDEPATVGDALLKIHKTIPESPYAGIWAAVALSSGTNRVAQATGILNESIRRIRDQRKELPDRHAWTLAAAFNNLAVCHLKQRERNAAASALIEAVEASDRSPPAVRHNVHLLSKIGEVKNSPLTLAERNQKKLAEAAGPLPGWRDGWYYTLDFNVPRAAGAAQPLSEIENAAAGGLTIRDTWCIACGGDGVLPCPAHCNQGAVSVKKRVAVGVNRLTGGPIYGDKTFRTRCRACDGSGGKRCPHCKAGRL